MKEFKVDYDIIGLSFYPSWGDSMEGLKKEPGRSAFIWKRHSHIETAYPSRAMKQTATITWPMTPAGQKKFLDDLISTVQNAADHRGTASSGGIPKRCRSSITASGTAGAELV